MSASLVGSEMCIRDRSTASPDLPEKRLRRARRPVSSSPSDLARKMAPNPVSYTHLTLPTICSV
eukprot:14617610-Alexandrium_andersonii.AAC.1